MNKQANISKHYVVLSIVILLFLLNYFFYSISNHFFRNNIILLITYSIVLYIGVTRHRLNYFFTSINSGSKNGLSLTFDDGPQPEYTEKVLDILAEKEVTATFFIIGKNIKGNESIIKRIYQEGHIIGNHTTNHSYLNNLLPSKKIAQEIKENEQKIASIIGEKTNYYRTPFGLSSPKVARAIKRAKITSIGWDFRSFDTMAKDKDKLLTKLKKNAQKTSIMLLHDSNKLTIEILADFLDDCKTNGIEIVSLDKMIGINPYKK